MSAYEVMVVVECSVVYTVEAESEEQAIEEAHGMFSASDLDVHDSDITQVLIESPAGSRHFQ